MVRLGGASATFIVAYGAAHGAKSLIWHASELLFAFFLTEAIGLPAAFVGLVLAVSMLGNAAMDLTLGWLIRNAVTNSLQAARLQAFGAVASGLALTAFASTGLVPTALQPGFAVGSMVVFRLAYPLLDNPQNAMLAFATQDDGGRARVASVRYIGGGSAKLALAALFAPMMINAGPTVQAGRFWWLALALALLAIATSVLLYRQVRRHPDVRIAATGKKAAPPIQSPLAAEIGPIVVFAIALSLSATAPIFSRLMPYFSAFAIGDVSEAAMILSAAALGSVVGQFGWARLAQAWPLVTVLRAALITTVSGSILFLFGSGQGGVIAALCVAIYGLGFGGVLMSMWSLLAGVASAPGSRIPGTAAFGLYTCCSKSGHALSAGLVGLILAGLDYRTQTVAAGALVTWMTVVPIMGLTVVALLTLRVADRRAIWRSASRLRFSLSRP